MLFLEGEVGQVKASANSKYTVIVDVGIESVEARLLQRFLFRFGSITAAIDSGRTLGDDVKLFLECFSLNGLDDDLSSLCHHFGGQVEVANMQGSASEGVSLFLRFHFGYQDGNSSPQGGPG